MDGVKYLGLNEMAKAVRNGWMRDCACHSQRLWLHSQDPYNPYREPCQNIGSPAMNTVQPDELRTSAPGFSSVWQIFSFNSASVRDVANWVATWCTKFVPH